MPEFADASEEGAYMEAATKIVITQKFQKG